jgi:hypothetical protein
MTTKIIKNILTGVASTDKQAIISKVLGSNSYVVTDASNRKFVVYSSSVWKIGNSVSVEGNRIVESSYTKKQTVFQV